MKPASHPLLCAAALWFAPLPATALPPVVQSSFDTDTQGWQLVDFPSSHVASPALGAATWDGSTGNPAGSLRVGDVYYDTGVAAPIEYLGDKSAYYGGALEYDIVIRYTDATPYWELILNDGTQSLFYSAPAPALGVLERRSVPLTEAGWHTGRYDGPATTQAEMQQVLANLAGAYIRTEWRTGPDDTTIDNVRLHNGLVGGVIAFAASRFSRAENSASGYAAVHVERSGDLTGSVEVGYATADGSARDGLDYVATSGTLFWGSGKGGRRTISIPVLDDALDEAAETVRVSLAQPSGATLGAPAVATLSIADDDLPPSVSVASTSRAILEGTGAAQSLSLNVNLSAASGRKITVPYTVTWDSAAPDDVASIVPAQLVFLAGQTQKRITLTTAPDAVPEGNESLTIQLGAPVNATLGSPASTQVIIRNDD